MYRCVSRKSILKNHVSRTCICTSAPPRLTPRHPHAQRCSDVVSSRTTVLGTAPHGATVACSTAPALIPTRNPESGGSPIFFNLIAYWWSVHLIIHRNLIVHWWSVDVITHRTLHDYCLCLQLEKKQNKDSVRI